MLNTTKMALYDLDNFSLIHIFSYLDQTSQVRFTSVHKRFVELRNYVYEITTTKTMRDNQLQLFKNVHVLHLCNDLITDEGLKYLPIKELYCGYNDLNSKIICKLSCVNYLGIGNSKEAFNIVEHPLIKMLRSKCNNNLTDEGIKNLPLTHLYCDCNQNFTDDSIKNPSLTYLDCGVNNNFTDEGIINLQLKYLKCGNPFKFLPDTIMKLRKKHMIIDIK